ncbi:MAG: helix-hairpin-helix domain-containing protein, partial [Bacteroides sp.]|nr:helix-hairpin-helix domain-containing protein [Bacteroides sp.]
MLGEKIQKNSNEAGICIGLETKILQSINLSAYGDFFYFPWYRYQVDHRNTLGVSGNVLLSYSHSNSLGMLIKYS